MARCILLERDQGVGCLTLNRPDVLNSFNRQMAQEFQDGLEECSEDSSLRCVLVTGAGRAFCAGQDLGDVISSGELPGAEIRRTVEENYNRTIRLIVEMEKPVVCAVNGVAAGAGANVALCCDLVLAAEDASFIQSFCNIGLIPDSGGTYFLPRLIGLPRAKALMLTGEKVPAGMAAEIGMIYRVCPSDTLLEEASNLARRLAQQPTRALGLTKRALNQALVNGLEDQLILEGGLQAIAAQSSDFAEGVAAFLEKRKPVFRGE